MFARSGASPCSANPPSQFFLRSVTRQMRRGTCCSPYTALAFHVGWRRRRWRVDCRSLIGSALRTTKRRMCRARTRTRPVGWPPVAARVLELLAEVQFALRLVEWAV